jgi:hypothetical protein
VFSEEENKMKDATEVMADTHEPGSLETVLSCVEPRADHVIYSTGDHIPSGMKGPEREMVDSLRASGVKDVRPALEKAYKEDPEYRKAVDAHYQKTVVNMRARIQALKNLKVGVITGAGNQDFAVGKKIKENYGGPDIFKDFDFSRMAPLLDDEYEKYIGLKFVLQPDACMEGETAVVFVPHNPAYRKDKRPFEEILEECRKPGFENDKIVWQEPIRRSERVLILSHQSIDCTRMGLPDEARDAYTDPGNRALITFFYEFACEAVGAENVQLVHGHHHKPYQQYEFRGSRVHNLDIGDLLLVDRYTGETEVQHLFQRF